MNDELRNEILARWRGGQSGRQIARELHVSRTTVAKVIADHQQQRVQGATGLPTPRKRRGSQVDEHEATLRNYLSRYPDMSAVRLWEELRARGYKGGYSVLRQRVRQLRQQCLRSPVERFETGPGAQAQMDWALYTIDFTQEGRRKVNRAFQGGQQIVAAIATRQRQDPLGLVPAVALRSQQPLQEPHGRRPQLGKPLLQRFAASHRVTRWKMSLLAALAVSFRRREPPMPRQDLQPRVVDGDFLVRDPHREHLPEIMPRHRVAVLRIGDEPLRVHSLPVETYVGHFRQPPGGHLVEMLQGAALAAAQEVRFHEVKRPLDLALGLWTPGTAGRRPEAVMRGEGQQASIVDRLVAFVTRHHDLHVVVEAGCRHSPKVLEGAEVLTDRGFQVLRRREVQILPPGIAQHVAEKVRYGAFSANSVERILAVQARPKSPLERLADEEPGDWREVLGDESTPPRPATEYQHLLFEEPEEHDDTEEKDNAGPEDDGGEACGQSS
jgi:transposase